MKKDRDGDATDTMLFAADDPEETVRGRGARSDENASLLRTGDDSGSDEEQPVVERSEGMGKVEGKRLFRIATTVSGASVVFLAFLALMAGIFRKDEGGGKKEVLVANWTSVNLDLGSEEIRSMCVSSTKEIGSVISSLGALSNGTLAFALNELDVVVEDMLGLAEYVRDAHPALSVREAAGECVDTMVMMKELLLVNDVVRSGFSRLEKAARRGKLSSLTGRWASEKLLEMDTRSARVNDPDLGSRGVWVVVDLDVEVQGPARLGMAAMVYSDDALEGLPSEFVNSAYRRSEMFRKNVVEIRTNEDAGFVLMHSTSEELRTAVLGMMKMSQQDAESLTRGVIQRQKAAALVASNDSCSPAAVELMGGMAGSVVRVEELLTGILTETWDAWIDEVVEANVSIPIDRTEAWKVSGNVSTGAVDVATARLGVVDVAMKLFELQAAWKHTSTCNKSLPACKTKPVDFPRPPQSIWNGNVQVVDFFDLGRPRLRMLWTPVLPLNESVRRLDASFLSLSGAVGSQGILERPSISQSHSVVVRSGLAPWTLEEVDLDNIEHDEFRDWLSNRLNLRKNPRVAICATLVPTSQSSLAIDQLETVFHAAGDCLSQGFVDSPYISLAKFRFDISSVPGIVFRRWATDPAVLRRFVPSPIPTIPSKRPGLATAIRHEMALIYTLLSIYSQPISFSLSKSFDPNWTPIPSNRSALPHSCPPPLLLNASLARQSLLALHPTSPFSSTKLYQDTSLALAQGPQRYSRLWAFAVARDVLNRFETAVGGDDAGLLAETAVLIARAWRHEILAKGNTIDPTKIFVDFLGRPVSAEGIAQLFRTFD